MQAHRNDRNFGSYSVLGVLEPPLHQAHCNDLNLSSYNALGNALGSPRFRGAHSGPEKLEFLFLFSVFSPGEAAEKRDARLKTLSTESAPPIKKRAHL